MFRLAAEKSMKFGIFLVIQDSFFVTFVNGEFLFLNSQNPNGKLDFILLQGIFFLFC
jgi:hypothetical protein